MKMLELSPTARWLAAPSVLIAIAIYQIYLVQTVNLTPWKGGGFGMFSTDRTGATRTVRIYLTARAGKDILQLPVAAPRELGTRVLDLRQAPTLEGARALARTFAILPWREPVEIGALEAGGSAALVAKVLEQRDRTTSNEQLRRLLTLPRAWIAGLRSTARHGEGRPIDFDQVRVEVWEVRYDADGPALRSALLVEVSSESRRLFARRGGGV